MFRKFRTSPVIGVYQQSSWFTRNIDYGTVLFFFRVRRLARLCPPSSVLTRANKILPILTFTTGPQSTYWFLFPRNVGQFETPLIRQKKVQPCTVYRVDLSIFGVIQVHRKIQCIELPFLGIRAGIREILPLIFAAG